MLCSLQCLSYHTKQFNTNTLWSGLQFNSENNSSFTRSKTLTVFRLVVIHCFCLLMRVSYSLFPCFVKCELVRTLFVSRAIAIANYITIILSDCFLQVSCTSNNMYFLLRRRAKSKTIWFRRLQSTTRFDPFSRGRLTVQSFVWWNPLFYGSPSS